MPNRIPHPRSITELRQAFQYLEAETAVLGTGASGEILVGAGVDVTPTWATSLTTLTLLTVDNITINAAVITSDTGAISFDDENLVTTGTIGGINVTSGADPGHTHTGASLSTIDISADTNLAVTSPIVLTDDTLSLNQSAVDHGSIGGLGDDDHTLYHTNARGDARYYTETELDAGQLDNRYFTETEHLDSSAGAGDAGKPIKLNASGYVDATMLSGIYIDHGALSGLGDDDHTIYLLADGSRNLAGNLAVDALVTIDGRDISVDGTALDATIAIQGMVGIDSGATPGYLGAAANDGVLRASTGISYADGGDFITLTTNDGEIVHDNLSGAVANEHIDHSAVSVSAGTGLTGGGTITTTRTISLSHLGIQSLSDPGADRILFWDDVGAAAVTWLVVSTGLQITTTNLTTKDSEIVHDNLSGYDANKHVDHTGVTLTAGSGMAGGGDISTSRSFDLDINSLSVATIAAGDFVPFWDITATATNKKITFANFEGTLDHGSLSGLNDADHDAVYYQETEHINSSAGVGDAGKPIVLDAAGHIDATMINDADVAHASTGGYDANEHVDHTGVSISTSTGLTGGGTIATTRTLSLSHLGIESLSDPGADRILFWDNGGSACGWLTVSTGLDLTTTNLTLSHLGIESLSDPGGDRILFWDDDQSATGWLTASTGLTISGTNITTNDGEIAHDSLSGYDANKHVDHTGVSISTGAGLTGGGDISSTRTLSLSHLGIQSLSDPGADRIMFWDDVGAAAVTWLTVSTGLQIATTNLTTKDSEIVHDNLSGYDANKHVDHTGVSITTAANSGLAGGGTIASTRTLVLDINNLTATGIAAGDFLAFWDITATAATKKITFANFEGTLSHDSLTSGTIADHDTSATGAELDTLTDNSIADTLHRHSELVASDGAPDPALSIDASGTVVIVENVQLVTTTTSTTGVVFKGADRFLHNFHHPTGNSAVPDGKNVFLGLNSGNFSAGSTATSTTHGSYNSAVGYATLDSLTTGYFNMAFGAWACRKVETGFGNAGVGTGALYEITSGDDNLGIGTNAGRYIDGGAANQTTNQSTYLGYNTRASADGADNEIVIGKDAIGKGTNTAIVGGADTTIVFVPSLGLLERSTDPAEPAEGECVIWMSDGSEKGDDGDIMVASQAGGTTNVGTLFDHSGGAAW